MDSVIEYQQLGPGPKILWLRLFKRYGYQKFSGSYKEMGEELDINRYTAREQISALKSAGAVDIDFKRGNGISNGFRLIDPADWA